MWYVWSKKMVEKYVANVSKQIFGNTLTKQTQSKEN